MSRSCRLAAIVWACLIGWSGAGPRVEAEDARDGSINGIIWVANRGAHTIRPFDADTGAVAHTVSMAPNSQPGDLAFAQGKVYVAGGISGTVGRHSEPSARPTLTSAPSAKRRTRTSQGLQQTSQSCTKLPRTSSSTWISTSSPQ